MRVHIWTWAAAIAVTISVLGNCVQVDAAEDVCESTTCQNDNDGENCDRLSEDCPPCLFEKSSFFRSKILCMSLTSDGECPEDTTLCKTAAGPPDSSSGSAHEAPAPTTIEPTAAPEVKSNSKSSSSSSSGSKSGSGSGSSSTSNQTTTQPTPKTETPMYTTSPPNTPPNPKVDPPKPPKGKLATPMPPPTPKPKAKESNPEPEAPISQANSNTSNDNNPHPNNQMPMIIGIAGGAFVMVAAVMFFIWKRRKVDDEESDDEGGLRYDPPKPPYTAPAVKKASSTTSKRALQPSAPSARLLPSAPSARQMKANLQYSDASSFDESQRSLQLDEYGSSNRGLGQQQNRGSMGSEWDTAEFGASVKQRRGSSNASVEF